MQIHWKNVIRYIMDGLNVSSDYSDESDEK